MTGVRARADDTATARGEVGLIERAPAGDASLIAVMDDDHASGGSRSQRSQR